MCIWLYLLFISHNPEESDNNLADFSHIQSEIKSQSKNSLTCYWWTIQRSWFIIHYSMFLRVCKWLFFFFYLLISPDLISNRDSISFRWGLYSTRWGVSCHIILQSLTKVSDIQIFLYRAKNNSFLFFFHVAWGPKWPLKRVEIYTLLLY